MMRNWPESSVTAVRTFSMSAGLAASTVTPGSTPPDVSRTVPVSVAWAICSRRDECDGRGRDQEPE